MQAEENTLHGTLAPSVNAKPASRHLVTPRDLEMLAALDRTPLTALQLQKLSETFAQPFGSERMVRERLQAHVAAGWVRSAHYATVEQGAAPKYFFLTSIGFALVHGPAAPSPHRRTFAPLPVTRHRHSRALADFVVQLYVTAHRTQLQVQNYYPENLLRLTVDGESLVPDGAFELRTSDGKQWNFIVEIDCGTERVVSTRDIDSWQRKIRLYDRLQDLNYPHRFRVLAICTGGHERRRHILTTAAKLFRNPQRTLVYGGLLRDFLSPTDVLREKIFLDHLQRPVALIPDGRMVHSPTVAK